MFESVNYHSDNFTYDLDFCTDEEGFVKFFLSLAVPEVFI